MVRPRGVSLIDRELRSKRITPGSVSSVEMRCETADCLVWIVTAALWKLLSVAIQ